MESTASVETPATISYAKVVAPASASYKAGAAMSAVPPPAAANKLEGAVEAVELTSAPVAGDGEEDESFRFVII